MDDSPTVWREGEIVVVRRDRPLPPICLFTGQPAQRRVSCLFHCQQEPLAATGPLGLAWHYWRNVTRARLEIPLAEPLMRRRQIAWVLYALTAALALATIGGLIGMQAYLAGLPAGPTKKQWHDVGPPAVALSGFLLTGLAALASYKIMPMPTVRLMPVRITSECVWLTGVAKEYLAQLPTKP
jgi:hypothetical protein